MKSRLRNRHARRLASDLRWWLKHYSGCHACSYDPVGVFTRVGFASSAIAEYLYADAARYPVRIPRRFWRELGRVVVPGNSAAIAFWSNPTESAMVREEDG
jgi:hypothetical protein